LSTFFNVFTLLFVKRDVVFLTNNNIKNLYINILQKKYKKINQQNPFIVFGLGPS